MMLMYQNATYAMEVAHSSCLLLSHLSPICFYYLCMFVDFDKIKMGHNQTDHNGAPVNAT